MLAIRLAWRVELLPVPHAGLLDTQAVVDARDPVRCAVNLAHAELPRVRKIDQPSSLKTYKPSPQLFIGGRARTRVEGLSP
jgi:hypothetical protein